MSHVPSGRLRQLILLPALITLAVTLLRLAGELLSWSPKLFSREPGGGASLVGITWLVPVFGAWFGWRLARSGERPQRVWLAMAVALLALLVLPMVGFASVKAGVDPQGLTMLVVFVLSSIVALVVGLLAWPAIGRILVAYGLAARIPVILVMLVAMLARWGTHYDVAPPGLPAMSPIAKWLTIGVMPQLTIWIWFTVGVGSLFGSLAAGLTPRRPGGA
jgi:hypothetical protein